MDGQEQTPTTDQKQTEQAPAVDEKTFTQEEVDTLLSERLGRQEHKLRQTMRGEIEAEIRQKIEAEENEAKKLKRMNDEQRREYEYKKKDEELAELRAKVNRNEMERTATDILAQKGITANSDILAFVVADTAEKTTANIDKFVDLVEVQARTNRKQDFTSPTPKNGGSGEGKVDQKTFAKMTYTERLNLKDSQPEVYADLIKKIMK